MEIFQFYSGIILLGLAAFLFLEERNFKKNMIKIKGKVVGYSKGKSDINKRIFYPVIEFTHPSGELGWIESHKILRPPLQILGAEVPLVVDRDDFHIARTYSSLSSLWAWAFAVLAIAELSSFAHLSPVGWTVGSITLLLMGVCSFFVKESLVESEQNYKIVSTWRSWQLQIVKSRVYNEAEVENIRFWDKENCLKFFKSGNRMKMINLAYLGLWIVVMFFLGFEAYVENERFYSTAHKSTATIVKIASRGTPVFEYHDIEGVPHRALIYGGIAEEKLKVGNKFDVLYTSNNYREIRHDRKNSMHFELAIWAFFVIYSCAMLFLAWRLTPKLDLNSRLITSAEELIMKKAS